ncbi:hypothetical protein [Celerinatantimonas sp. MCCC 1A17872]|uniref:hypothetical protein n=1 Tax=Celerinatantimonas sp. MCCC 1A17872 TaxID=3177514 RepID=UPI0038CB2E49
MIRQIFDEFNISIDGDMKISNKKYFDVSFDDFMLNPMDNKRMKICDVTFDKCKILSHQAYIMKGVTLNNVIFEDFNCGDILNISSEAELVNVKIIGGDSPKMIWIRPESKNITNSNYSKHCQLDISEYSGEVSITGVSVELIKINTQEHILIRVKRFNSIDWNSLGISALSYWKIMLRKVIADNSESGIFSLPPSTGKNYHRSMNELLILKEHGYIDS